MRSGGSPYKASEGWAPVSGVFNDPEEASGSYGDLYLDIYVAVDLNRDAMHYVKDTWLANTGASDAVLKAKVNATLTGFGFTKASGGQIE